MGRNLCKTLVREFGDDYMALALRPVTASDTCLGLKLAYPVSRHTNGPPRRAVFA